MMHHKFPGATLEINSYIEILKMIICNKQEFAQVARAGKFQEKMKKISEEVFGLCGLSVPRCKVQKVWGGGDVG